MLAYRRTSLECCSLLGNTDYLQTWIHALLWFFERVVMVGSIQRIANKTYWHYHFELQKSLMSTSVMKWVKQRHIFFECFPGSYDLTMGRIYARCNATVIAQIRSPIGIWTNIINSIRRTHSHRGHERWNWPIGIRKQQPIKREFRLLYHFYAPPWRSILFSSCPFATEVSWLGYHGTCAWRGIRVLRTHF